MLTLPPRIPQEGPAVSLLNSLSAEGFFNNEASFTVDLLSLVGYSEVVAKESERSLAINLLLRFVRNVLVYDSVVEGEKWFQREHPNDAAICCMIATLEIHGTSNGGAMDYGGATGRRVNKIITKLMGGNRRDVVKFVAKRLPCTCLKKLHSAARKKVTKMGICIACSKQFPRSQLFVCTGCSYDSWSDMKLRKHPSRTWARVEYQDCEAANLWIPIWVGDKVQ
ncbi:hypothetical protein THAOC_21836 [Thalassiosira oceanica]|uniref:Uncharacterized protein n=1 Tax=Thalassiosira oceanica TaxID=159749 RepID=K0RYH1_THAOC|nr:hypothetical protein THAOC_21836 [Thalassiosira oceanica]|eukprot:EJK58065.1 hypothetical protein THAOC_21836 [Thalassiosira oceanica]